MEHITGYTPGPTVTRQMTYDELVARIRELEAQNAEMMEVLIAKYKTVAIFPDNLSTPENIKLKSIIESVTGRPIEEVLGFDIGLCESCEWDKVPADLPEAGASAERISSVVRSNADETENLKCCGNCLHRSTIDMGSYSDETCDKDNNLSSWQYCQKWEFDGIERSGRTEGFDVK